MKDSMNSEKLRMNGFLIGAILFVASLFVASSVTAIVNLVLIALPVLTIAAVIGIFAVGIPLLFAGIQAGREAQANAAVAHDSAVLLSLEGFWKHAHSWDKDGHAHYKNFQPLDHDIVIHLDSQSDDHSMTMREFMQMTSAPGQQQGRELDKSLEGLTDYRRL